MSHRLEFGAVGMFQNTLPFYLMCDEVVLPSSNTLAATVLGPGHCLLNVDPSILCGTLKNRRPTRPELTAMATKAVELAKNSPILQELPPLCEGIDAQEVIAAFFIFTMEEPYPLYRLITDLFIYKGERESWKEQRAFIKLLLIAHRCIPHADDGPYYYNGPVFFGIGENSDLPSPEILENPELHFVVGQKFALAAPIFCSASPDDVRLRYPTGISIQIENPGAVKVVPGVLSSCGELEYLPIFPLKVEVTFCKKVGAGWCVTLEVVSSIVSYLSLSPCKTVGQADAGKYSGDDYAGPYIHSTSACVLGAGLHAKTSIDPALLGQRAISTSGRNFGSPGSKSVAAGNAAHSSSATSSARHANAPSYSSISTLKSSDIAALVSLRLPPSSKRTAVHYFLPDALDRSLPLKWKASPATHRCSSPTASTAACCTTVPAMIWMT